ncbi:MAG: adenosine kinase [Desulfobacterales bacterium]|jgi:sugar/nucleoside kinase (ribokinase family)
MHKKLKIIGVGSPIIDHLAHVNDEFVSLIAGGKGGMELVDTAVMKKLLEECCDPAVMAPGGSAANTAFALARLNLPAAIWGKVGDDDEGRFYCGAFEQIGGDASRIKICTQSATACCLCLISPDSERTMRTDLGAAAGVRPEEVCAQDFQGCSHAHVEGYLLFNRPLAVSILAAARAAGCTISLDLGSYEVVHANADVLPGLLSEYVDVVMANEDEAAAFCGSDDPKAGLSALSACAPLAVVKLGSRGAYLKNGNQYCFVKARSIDDAVDATGAGDFWAAGFLYGHLQGYSLEDSGRFGAVLGGEAVRHVGADLSHSAWKQAAVLFDEIKNK